MCSAQVAVVTAPVPPEAPVAPPSITPARATTNRETEGEKDPIPGPSGWRKKTKREPSPRAADILKVFKPNDKPDPKKKSQNRPGQ